MDKTIYYTYNDPEKGKLLAKYLENKFSEANVSSSFDILLSRLKNNPKNIYYVRASYCRNRNRYLFNHGSFLMNDFILGYKEVDYLTQERRLKGVLIERKVLL